MQIIKAPLEDHRQNPDLTAEIRFFDAMVNSGVHGSIAYNLNIGRQVDAVAWTRPGGRFAFEAKGGGLHWLENGLWYAQDRNGNHIQLRLTPVEQAMRAALAASDALEERLKGHKPWIVPVLVMVDMANPDPNIVECARDHRVQLIWGLNDLEGQIDQIARANPEYHPPSDLDIAAEAAAFERRDPPAEWVAPAHAQRKGGTVSKPAAITATPDGPDQRQGFTVVVNNCGTVIFQSNIEPRSQSAPDDALIIRAQVEPDASTSAPPPFDGGMEPPLW